jgi:hypothetical protein
MLHEYYTRLSITLETSSGERLDEPNAVTSVFTTEMSDCSVHAWFKLFERILAVAGFDEQIIMLGGAQLAFNEERSIENMRSVAKQYDLRLLEDLNSDGPATEDPD